MELYQINYLIIIIIGVIFLLRQKNKKETFENLDTFIKNTNNGKWNFSTYNPYSNLNEYSNMFIFTYNNENTLTYNENLFYNQKTLKKVNTEMLNRNSELYNYIIKLLNKYNDSTNQVVITKQFFNNKRLQVNYNVKLINAYDKLNYIKNKTKLNNLINTNLIKDLISFYINKHIYITEDTIFDTQYEDKDNLVVQLDYKTDKIITKSLDYILIVLKKIKEYLKMDIIDNGTVIDKNNDNKIFIKFKVITYLLDDNDREVLNNKIIKLHKILFNQLLNTNDNNNIIRNIEFSENELEYLLRNICIYKSGLCKKNVSENIPTPKCSVKTQEKNILNTFEIKPDETCTDKKDWKNHIVSHLKDSYKNNCNKFDIDYNLQNNETYELNIYSEVKIDNEDDVIDKVGLNTNTDNCSFVVTKKNEEPLNICNFNENKDRNINNIKNYMKEIEKIKGIDQNTMNNIKSVLLSKIEIEKFNVYITYEKNKAELKLLRAFGKVFKFLEIISKLDSIEDTIKEEFYNLVESENDITKNKLTAILFYIINKHIKNNNNEFKLNEKIPLNETELIKRHKIIRMYIEENYEILLEKLLIMNTSEKIELLDNTKTDYDNIVLELEMIEKMSTTQLSNYFSDINEIFPNKDVNDRLKIITNHNNENTLRIHKKLNQLQGGFKLSGGNNDKPINGNIYRIRNKLFPQRHIHMNNDINYPATNTHSNSKWGHKHNKKSNNYCQTYLNQF